MTCNLHLQPANYVLMAEICHMSLHGQSHKLEFADHCGKLCFGETAQLFNVHLKEHSNKTRLRFSMVGEHLKNIGHRLEVIKAFVFPREENNIKEEFAEVQYQSHLQLKVWPSSPVPEHLSMATYKLTWCVWNTRRTWRFFYYSLLWKQLCKFLIFLFTFGNGSPRLWFCF